MKPLLCYLPEFPAGLEENRSAWVKRTVLEALDKGLVPALLPAAGLTRLTVAIPTEMGLKVSQLATEHGVADGRMVGMLVLAVANLERAGKEGGLQDVASSVGDRPEQARILMGVLPHLIEGKLAIVEAGTGVGKSRIAGRIAQELWSSDGLQIPVVVATPTVAQLSHLAREIQALKDEQAKQGRRNKGAKQAAFPDPTFVLGRSQFIDLDAALDLAYASDNQAAVNWIEAGAPAGLNESTNEFANFVPGICGLMEDWLSIMGTEIAPVVDPAECVLHEDSSEASLESYRALRASAHDSPLILCTHAMVGVDLLGRSRQRRSGGKNKAGAQGSLLDDPDEDDVPNTILPVDACYIIDEAHLLENEVANVASQGVSLHSLAKTLRDARWAPYRASAHFSEAAAAAEAAITSLRPIGGVTNRSVLLPANLREPEVAKVWVRALDDISKLENSLAAILKKLSASKSKGTDSGNWQFGRMELVRARRAIVSALTGSHVVEVSTSPVRRFATLTTGPSSVAWLMSILWQDARCAVVMSGTLLLPTFMGHSSGYIKQMLTLPEERAALLPPEHPAWTVESQTMMLPSGSARAWLTPPPTDTATPEQMKGWMQHVASVVVKAADSALGGTLVLLSGYERIEMLNDELPPELAGRLVVQGRNGPNLLVCQARFRAMHAQGLRPIWLATGGAWTGLDLRDRGVPDDQASEDTLLTDVIIPNAPFGLNRSTTHASRCQRLIKFEAMSTALILRQGLGRLVRREGLLGRRLWVLDARLLTRDAAKGRSMFQQCALMLELFKNHEAFRMDEGSKTPG